MARQEGVRITGLREVVRDLERFGVSTDDLKEAFGEIARDVATESGRIVKVKTGALLRTIRPGKTKNKAIVRAGTAVGVPYAGVINYGRDGFSGDQFLTGPANADPEGKVRRIEANLAALKRKHNL